MTRPQKSLRVVLDARLPGGQSGGVEQAIVGLAYGLSHLDDGEEEYYFLTLPGHGEWLKPYVSGPCRIVTAPLTTTPKTLREWLKTFPWLRSLWQRLTPFIGPAAVRVPRSDGYIEALQADLMHFTFQSGFFTPIPTIYQPWDMQHRHLPQYFSAHERLTRDVVYTTLCRQARLVIVASSWTRRDIIKQLALPETLVHVIPMAAPLITAKSQATQLPAGLPETFVLYPAQTWPHKNHLALLDALAILRDQDGLRLPLVCIGRKHPHFFPRLERRVRELQLDDQIFFTGFQWPTTEFYARARCVVFPSRFEGFGMPVIEAFEAGVPLASSNATCLPDLVGKAGLIFDPDDVHAIAAALKKLWFDEPLRTALIERGRIRARHFSWERTAHLYRAHYRQLVLGEVSSADRDMLDAPPIV